MQKLSNKNKISSKSMIILFSIALIMGIFGARQFILAQKINNQVGADTNEALAYEVSELFKHNSRLSEEISQLEEEVFSLEQSYIDIKKADETLSGQIADYEIVLGNTKVEGEGVVITFENKVASTQIVDLINALRNIGVDAVSVNGKRYNYSSSIASGVFSPPTTIETIGDKDLIYDSLNRSGGIIDQIEDVDIQKRDNITLSSI